MCSHFKLVKTKFQSNNNKKKHKSLIKLRSKCPNTNFQIPASIYAPIEYNVAGRVFVILCFRSLKTDLKQINNNLPFFVSCTFFANRNVFQFSSLPQRHCWNKLCIIVFSFLPAFWPCLLIHCCICSTNVCHRARCLRRSLHALFLKHYYVSVTWH